MLTGIRHTAVLALGCVVVALALAACGGGPSEADIEATVEARLNEERAREATVETRAQTMAKAMVEATAQAAPTATPVPPTPTPTHTPTPTATPVPPTASPTQVPLTVTPTPVEIAQQKADKSEQDEAFWNKPMWDGLPKCTTDFGFSHQLVAPIDIMEIMFGPGSHVWPHEHMTYWGVAGEAGGVDCTAGFVKQVSLKAPRRRKEDKWPSFAAES